MAKLTDADILAIQPAWNNQDYHIMPALDVYTQALDAKLDWLRKTGQITSKATMSMFDMVFVHLLGRPGSGVPYVEDPGGLWIMVRNPQGMASGTFQIASAATGVDMLTPTAVSLSQLAG